MVVACLIALYDKIVEVIDVYLYLWQIVNMSSSICRRG